MTRDADRLVKQPIARKTNPAVAVREHVSHTPEPVSVARSRVFPNRTYAGLSDDDAPFAPQ